MARFNVGLALLSLLSAVSESNSASPPGKPELLSCRSPEKETFTCWWKPGSDGGLPTTHHLYYERERLEGVHECPDYLTVGRDSCFFDKNHTSIWVDYYLIVVASNALGNATSDPLKFDVMEIVKPNPPENVTVAVEKSGDSTNLHIRWEHPYDTDTKSGWVTLKYGIRVKQQNTSKWKEYLSGIETYFSLYGISPGMVYSLQVRCRLDHGSWSEWSHTTHVKVPKSHQNGKSFWLFVSTLSAIPFMAAMCILVMKRSSVKQCILPPVPGPKIRGVDFQHLKSGQTEDITSALMINQNFPLMVAWKVQMEEYLIVTEIDNGPPPDSSKNLMIQKQCEKFDKEKDEIAKLVKSNKFVSAEKLSEAEPPQLRTEKHDGSSMNFKYMETTEQSLRYCKNTLKPFTNCGYVDVGTPAENIHLDNNKLWSAKNHSVEGNSCDYMDIERREGNMSEDYSQVKDVNSDNMVFLQKQNASVYTEKGDPYTDCALQKPKNHVTGPAQSEPCTEFTDSGYIDTIPGPPLM